MGKTWKFPPSFSRGSSGPAMTEGAEELSQSVSLLLHTAPGERFLVPGYGFDWRELVFENANGRSASAFNPDYVKARLNDLFALYENRVEATEVEIRAEQLAGTVTLHLALLVRETGETLHLTESFR